MIMLNLNMKKEMADLKKKPIKQWGKEEMYL